MFTLDICNIKGEKVDKLELPETIFDGKVNKVVLHQAITNYLANSRKGNASTKTRGEVSGGGKKPWRQKGTGRARAGSIRSPLWRHGGVVFGPHPRDFGYNIPRRIKLLALKSSLNAKLNSGDLIFLDKFEITKPKTKEIVNILSNLKIKEKTLAAIEKKDENLERASRNIKDFKLLRAEDINAYDVLRYKKLIITQGALKNLLKRIK